MILFIIIIQFQFNMIIYIQNPTQFSTFFAYFFITFLNMSSSLTLQTILYLLFGSVLFINFSSFLTGFVFCYFFIYFLYAFFFHFFFYFPFLYDPRLDSSGYPLGFIKVSYIIYKQAYMRSKPSQYQTLLRDSPERNFRSPVYNHVKSEKALKIFALSPEGSRPFKRKQQANLNNCIINTNKKNKFEDVGKLISNTSFGFNPDIQKIVLTSPQQCLQAKQLREFVNQDKNYNNNINNPSNCRRQNLRHLRSFTQLQIDTVDSSNLLSCVENNGVRKKSNENGFRTLRQKQPNPENKQLRERVQKILKQKQQLQQKLKEKQNIIRQRSEELEREKQMNHCLEDIIIELNNKIKKLLVHKYTEPELSQEISTYQNTSLAEGMSIWKQIQLENQNRLKVKNMQLWKQEIQQQKEKIFALNRMIHSLEVENIIGKKIRAELEKEKLNTKYLQKQNKALKQRVTSILKARKAKGNKLSLKKQLEYSLSYSFQSEI